MANCWYNIEIEIFRVILKVLVILDLLEFKVACITALRPGSSASVA